MKGHYLYGVVPASEAEGLGAIGIGNAVVTTIPFGKVAAVVHPCDPDTQLPNDKKVIGEWLISHQDVVDKALTRFGVVVPSSFGTVIKGDGSDKTVAKWLSDNYEALLSELKNFVGKAEYGVQISWDTKKISEEIIQCDDELLSLRTEMQSASEGIAYIYKKKMEQSLKAKLEEKAFNLFKDIYDTLKGMADGIVIEKLKSAPDGFQMLANISCLVSKKDQERLSSLLDEINKANYMVKYTGPWPPYSFVGRHKIAE